MLGGQLMLSFPDADVLQHSRELLQQQSGRSMPRTDSQALRMEHRYGIDGSWC